MHRPRRRPRRPDHQLDLFQTNQTSASNSAPGWSTLPDQTRQAVTGPMTRLLIAHAGGAASKPGSDGDER
jgi:hypothetical protein